MKIKDKIQKYVIAQRLSILISFITFVFWKVKWLCNLFPYDISFTYEWYFYIYYIVKCNINQGVGRVT